MGGRLVAAASPHPPLLLLFLSFGVVVACFITLLSCFFVLPSLWKFDVPVPVPLGVQVVCFTVCPEATIFVPVDVGSLALFV